MLPFPRGNLVASFAVERLMTVGELARRSGLTAKALRHYDRIGLLRPVAVDTSGYRWYAPEQVAVAERIALLRRVDVPIDDVRRALDASDLTDVLVTQRRRLESRLTRVQRDLHALDHLITEGRHMPTKLEALDPEQERRLGAGLYNATWTLLEKEDRTREEDDAMLHMTHASAYHWRQVGKPENFARSEWQCSRVYAVLGRPEQSLRHARRCLEIVESAPDEVEEFDLPFACEALARAHALAGEEAESREWLARARAAGEKIADEDDRVLLESDLATITP
jgi:DNA-binding transcriptional MerR regulator